MSQFVQVTQESGKPVVINVEKILYVEPEAKPHSALVVFENDGSIFIRTEHVKRLFGE